MKQYRIYTEQVNIEWLKDIVAANFPGFTTYLTEGYWKHMNEKPVMIEIITDNPAAEHYLQLIVLKIKKYNEQISVLLTKQEIEIL